MLRRYQETRRALRIDPTSFPEIHLAGQMRPISQTIHVFQANGAAFREYGKGRVNLGQLQSHIETYIHEVMHWYDLVGSLWGAKFLDLIYTCLDIQESRPNTAEDEFHKLVEMYDEERRIMFPDYYRLVLNENRKHSPRIPWRIQFSCGLEFDAYGHQNLERPIFFISFLDNVTKELIARQPLTVGALLETKAIASELQTGIELITENSDSKDELLTRLAINSREKSNFLYNRHFTEYTAPAHLLSFFVGTLEANLTYDYAAALANVTLNMTDTHFDTLRHSDKFQEFGEQRLEAFRRSRDRGYAFAALAAHAGQYDPDVDLSNWLDAALERANLPLYAEFCEQTREALTNRNPLTLKIDVLTQARQELEEAGRNYYDVMTGEGFHFIKPSAELPMPYAFDCEGKLFNLGNALQTQAFHPEILQQKEWEFTKYRDNFLTGARGFRIIAA